MPAMGPKADTPLRADVRPSLRRAAAMSRLSGRASDWVVRPPEVTRYKLSEAVVAHEVSRSRYRLHPPHHVRCDVLQRRRAELLHGDAGLEPEHAEHAFDTGLSERAKTPQIGPADADGLCPDRQRLDDVAAMAEAGVDQNRDAATDSAHNFRQD